MEKPQQKMLSIITRHINRPLHNELKNMLAKTPWTNAAADLEVWYHGQRMSEHGYPTDAPIAEELAIYQSCPWLSDYCNMSGNTNGNIPQLVRVAFEYAIENKYEYLMLLDDDARFPNPTEAVNTFIKGLHYKDLQDSDDPGPIAGQVGPMGPLRKKWRYDNDPLFLQRLRHNPWTTLGCQVYRVAALEELQENDIFKYLDQLEFRADSFIAMALDMHGWGVYEMDVPFAHALHSGLRYPTKNSQHHREMLTRGEHDWSIYRQMFKDVCGTSTHDYQFYIGELHKLQHAHERHHIGKIHKMGETL